MANDGIIKGKDVIADDALKRVDDLNTKFLEVINTMSRLNAEATNFKSFSQGNSIIRKRVELEGGLAADLAERNRLLKALERQEARNRQATSETAKNLAAQRVETQRINKANKDAAIQTSRYASAYQKLALQTRKAKDELKNLIITEGKLSPATIKARKEFEKLNTRLREADNLAGDFQRNVGNYPTVFGGVKTAIRGLVGAFGFIEGVRLGYNLIKDSIALAREAKGVEFAFDRLGDVGVNAFERVRKSTRGLISDLDIKTALVDFDNFNISLEETDTLFEFLAVRAAQTGKSIDSLRDSLVEGLSKESKLRIDNLGISAAELNEELEKTPDFVKAVANIARREVAEAGNILDEASNGAERFSASIENIQLNFGRLFGSIKGLGFLNDFLEDYNNRFELLNGAFESNLSLMEKITFFYRNYTEAGRKENKRLLEEIELREEASKAIQEQIDAYVALNKSLAPLQQGQQEQTPSNGFSLFKEEEKRLLKDINTEIDKYNDQLKEGLFSSREEAKVIQDKIAALEKEKEAILGSNKNKKEATVLIEGTIAYYQDLISKEQEFQRTEAQTAAAIENSKEKIKSYQVAIDRLNGAFEKIKAISIGPEITDSVDGYSKRILENLEDEGLDLDGPLEELKRFNEARANGEKAYTKLLQDERNKQADIVEGLFSTFAGYYNLDLTAFTQAIEGKKALEIDYASSAKSIANALLESKLIAFDVEYQQNQEKLDAILNDEKASDKKKQQAQIEYNEKQKQLRIQEAKAKRDATLFQILLDTAQAIVASIAASPTTGGLPFSAYAAAAGALQAAFVRSQPLPQYYVGTENAKQGWAWTDERGAEIHTDKRGNIKDLGSDKGPRLKFLEHGDKIITAHETKNILNGFDRQIQSPIDLYANLAQKLNRDTKERTAMFAVSNTIDTKGIERVMEKVMTKHFGKNIKIQNNINLKGKRTSYFK